MSKKPSLPSSVPDLLAKAQELYVIRPFKPEDVDKARDIFTEGMLFYSQMGRRVGFQGIDAEHQAVLDEAEKYYCKAFYDYVDYALKDANMARMTEYWSLSRRSLFLVCEEKATGVVVGTVALQPAQLMGGWYGHMIEEFEQTLAERGVDYYDNAAEKVGMLPSEMYDVDDAAYDPSTYIALPTAIQTDPPQVIKHDRVLLTTDIPVSDTAPKRVPQGFYRRFQRNADFGLPLPVPVDTYTKYTEQASLEHPSVVADEEAGVYSYTTSMGAGTDLPPYPVKTGYAEAELRRMSVTRDHRSSGAAQLLLFTAIQTAKQVLGYNVVRLSTASTMESAVQFYRRMGLRECHFQLEHEPGTPPWPIVHFMWSTDDFDVGPSKYRHCGPVYSIGQ